MTSDPTQIKPFEASRESYASMFGPTKGDRLRLADTELWIEIEEDMTVYGDECKFGGGEQKPASKRCTLVAELKPDPFACVFCVFFFFFSPVL